MKLSSDVKTLKMKVVVKDKPEKGFSLQERVISTDLKADEVLVKINTASFCGTDYHIYIYDNWAKNRLQLPLVVGHEFSGEVIKVGSDVTRVKVGDIVSAETHIICDECEFCLRGEGHICENTKIIGVDTDGCFANYIKMPAANCFVNSKDIDPLILSLQEPLGNAVHTMNHFDIKGEDVVIRVLEETNGRGADVIGEFSGNKVAIEKAFKYIKAGGGISMLGLPAENIEIDLSKDVIYKGISIYGVTGRRIYDTWYQVKELIESGKLNLEKIITHKFYLRDVNKAAEIMGSGECGKIILLPEEIDE